MKMSAFEKVFVNRESKGKKNASRVRERLAALPVSRIDRALELGCGLGTVSAVLADEYALAVEGTDVDPDQIALARHRYGGRSGLSYAIEDATRLSYASASFDLVVAHNVFHHLEEWGWAVHETARVLRPGGHLLWLDFAVPRLVQRVLRWLRRPTLYSWPEIAEVFRAAGLEEVDHRTVRLGPLAHHDVVFRRAAPRLLEVQSPASSAARSPARLVGEEPMAAHGSAL